MRTDDFYYTYKMFITLASETVLPVAVFDIDVNYLACSQKWLEILCIEFSRIGGMNHFDLCPNTPEDLKEMFEKALDGERIALKEERYIMQDGAVRYFNWYISPWYKEAKYIGGITVYVNDVTGYIKNKMETENQLRSLREAQRLAKVGHWELDTNTNHLYWSDEVYRIFELQPQEFDGTYKGFIDRIHPEDREKVNNVYKKSVTDKSSYQITHRLITADNELKYVEEKCYHDYDSLGDIERSIGTVLDITQKKEKEILLDLLTKIYKAFLEDKEEVLFADLSEILINAFECEQGIVGYIDKKGSFVSPALTNTLFTDYETDKKSVILPKHIWSTMLKNTPFNENTTIEAKTFILAEESKILKNSIAAPILKNDQVIGMFLLGNKKNGFSKQDKSGCLEISQLISPILSNWLDNLFYKKELEEINLSLEERIEREIEVRKKNEQVMFEQKKFIDMGQMINAIAHQWRQPLNNIQLISNIMKDINDGIEYDVEYEELFDKHFMSSTIDDFRYFFSSKKEKTNFSIMKELLTTIELIKPQYDHDSINIIVSCGCNDNKINCTKKYIANYCNQNNDIVHGCSSGLKQVFLNILNNARDAILENYKKDVLAEKTIEIITDIGKNSVSIDFFNYGKNIPKDIMNCIFDPYFTTKEEGKGIGIGLYMSKEIIEHNLNGKLTCQNRDDGVVFNINIPL